jgi:hypothetical protein
VPEKYTFTLFEKTASGINPHPKQKEGNVIVKKGTIEDVIDYFSIIDKALQAIKNEADMDSERNKIIKARNEFIEKLNQTKPSLRKIEELYYEH